VVLRGHSNALFGNSALYFVPSGQYSLGMAKRTDGQATHELILATAAQLVAMEGPAALTLDRVAELSGISKGAVLYHFKSKNALVAALVITTLDQFDAATDVLVEPNTGHPGAYTQAYAKVTFNPASNTPEACAGLLAAVTNDIDLLTPAIERHAAIQKRLESDGISITLATLIRLAADGLYLTRAFGLAPPSNAVAAKVLKLLVSLIANSPVQAK
jgi:AcrR family transcriptional regulator